MESKDINMIAYAGSEFPGTTAFVSERMAVAAVVRPAGFRSGRRLAALVHSYFTTASNSPFARRT
jgi:hypothetical protein